MRPVLAGLALSLAACAGQGLVPGQSSVGDVEAKMGRPAEKRALAGGETVYYYPQLPWGQVTYAARIGADGRLIALEQRLTEENIAKVVKGRSTAGEVRDLLGPPYEPVKFERLQRDVWTYPMRIPADPTPKWFIVQFSPDGLVRETYLMDDPNFVPKDGGRRRH